MQTYKIFVNRQKDNHKNASGTKVIHGQVQSGSNLFSGSQSMKFPFSIGLNVFDAIVKTAFAPLPKLH